MIRIVHPLTPTGHAQPCLVKGLGEAAKAFADLGFSITATELYYAYLAKHGKGGTHPLPVYSRLVELGYTVHFVTAPEKPPPEPEQQPKEDPGQEELAYFDESDDSDAEPPAEPAEPAGYGAAPAGYGAPPPGYGGAPRFGRRAAQQDRAEPPAPPAGSGAPTHAIIGLDAITRRGKVMRCITLIRHTETQAIDAALTPRAGAPIIAVIKQGTALAIERCAPLIPGATIVRMPRP